MNDLTDDPPLTACGEMTFELVDHYLLVIMEDSVNGRLICGGKTGPKRLLNKSLWCILLSCIL